MKRPILWLAGGLLAGAVAVLAFGVLRGTPKPDGAGPPDGALPDPGTAVPVGTGGSGSSRGNASFYSVATNGTTTASGVPLDDSLSTAAHRTLPFGTRVRVTNLGNGLSETVAITDRGPFVRGRVIDVSRHAAEKLGMIQSGVVSVEIVVMPEGALTRKRDKNGD